jgi:hypothetical protein
MHTSSWLGVTPSLQHVFPHGMWQMQSGWWTPQVAPRGQHHPMLPGIEGGSSQVVLPVTMTGSSQKMGVVGLVHIAAVASQTA